MAGSLAGCPEERPGAAREISPQKFPPALPVEPQPATPTRKVDGAPPPPPEATPRPVSGHIDAKP